MEPDDIHVHTLWARVDRVVTHPPQDAAFTNNVWIVGDDDEVIVIDAAHSVDDIVDGIAGRTVAAIICTHGHWDHINVVDSLRMATGAPVFLNPADKELWDKTVATPWDRDLVDGVRFSVADVELCVLHTPGHTPGSTCLHAEKLHTVFTGDTLFKGGPGATRWDYSSFPTIIDSITKRLLVLPDETLVLTGHGDQTAIGAERPDREAWIQRGY